MTLFGESSSASSGFYVSYLYKEGASLVFNVTLDAVVSDAALTWNPQLSNIE